MTHFVYSTRPNNHPERTRCVAFVEPLLGRKLHVAVATALIERYVPAAEAYRVARVENEAATTVADRAAKAVNDCEKVFDDLFGKWTVAIDNVHDRGYAARVLPSKLGDLTPSAFEKQPPAVKADRMVTLAVHVSLAPELVGDPQKFAALQDAAGALQAALTVAEETVTTRGTTVQALKDASKVFDRCYGHLVKQLKEYDAAGYGARVPKFARVRPDPEATAADVQEDVEVGATSEAEGEDVGGEGA